MRTTCRCHRAQPTRYPGICVQLTRRQRIAAFCGGKPPSKPGAFANGPLTIFEEESCGAVRQTATVKGPTSPSRCARLCLGQPNVVAYKLRKVLCQQAEQAMFMIARHYGRLHRLTVRLIAACVFCWVIIILSLHVSTASRQTAEKLNSYLIHPSHLVQSR